MTIPEARTRLLAIAAQIDPTLAAEMQQIIKDGLYRRRGVVPVTPKSRKATPALGAKMRALHYNNPHMSEQDIAVSVGVNAGRVSEALIGKRT